MNKPEHLRSYSFILATLRYRKLIAFLTRIAIALRMKKVILIFGMSRSGTSMLGKFLSLGKSSIYMHEPETELMKEHFGTDRHYTQQKFWDFVHAKVPTELKVHTLVCISLFAVLKAPLFSKAIVIKPISFVEVIGESSEALTNANIIYICRHPAGRSESILRQLQHDQGIDEISLDALEQISQDWGRTNSTIKELHKKNPKWQWVFFEKLTGDPVNEFKKLYNHLGLPWNETIAKEIEESTTGMDGGYYNIQRDSRKQADKWRKSLTAEQIESVRKGTLPFETDLYESF